jgi:hypothetical protein
VSAASAPRSLAGYVPLLRTLDDEWRLRTVLHEFGMLWLDRPTDLRRELIDETPDHIDDHWDAFLASYVEHLCWIDELDPPEWVFDDDRFLHAFWYPATTSPTLRVEAVVHSPAAFEVRGVLMSDRELIVV